jgi:hypothetical protein
MEAATVSQQGVSLRTFAHVGVIIGHVCERGCLHPCIQCLLRLKKELGMNETQDVSVRPLDTQDRRSSSGSCSCSEPTHR